MEIHEIATDFPSSYEARVSASPWVASVGESLNDMMYVIRKIHISENGKACSANDLSIDVRRSRKDGLLERISPARQFNRRGTE